MKSLSLSIKLIAAALMLAAVPLLTAAQTTSLDGISDTFHVSGLIGISRGQAASLNFTNIAREVKEVHFYFFDVEGRLLKSSSAQVLPGQSMGLELSFSELRNVSTGRAQIRGVVRFATPPDPTVQPPEPDLGVSSLEVYDGATGKTSFGLLLPAVRSPRLYFPFTEVGTPR